VVNRAQISATPWTFSPTGSIVWSLDTQLRVPAHQTVTIPVTTSSLVYAPDISVALKANGSTTTTSSLYRASTDSAGSGVHPGLTFVVSQSAPDTLSVKITNATTQDAWLVSPYTYLDVQPGTPTLQLAAKLVTQGDTIISDFQHPPIAQGGAASSRFGEVAYQAADNPWIQDAATATQLAQDIVLDSYIPRPNLTDVTILPDPRLQLVDTVHIQDPDVTGVDEYARIYGWTLTWPNGGEPSMTIDARAIASPGATILGIPGRSELGVNTYLPAV
jgi:hypothetical protein